MLRKITLASAIFLSWLALTGFRPTAPPAAFQKALTMGKMVFTAPPGWVETPVIHNAQMDYNFALRRPGQRLEVRYAVRPLAPLLAEYARSKTRKDVQLVDPNKLYQTLFQVVTLNVADGQAGQSDEYAPQAVRQEFGADWGGTALVVPGRTFGQAYKHCMVVALHKANAADAYVFYLFDDQAAFQQLMQKPDFMAVFHSLRFQ